MIVIKFPKLETVPDNCSDCLFSGVWQDGSSVCRALELLSFYDNEATNPYIEYYLDVGEKHKDCPLAECEDLKVKLRFKKPQKMSLA